ALEINPNYASAHTALGVALGAQNKLVEAFGHFQKSVQLDPHYANGHFNLGVALSFKNDLEGAIGHLQKAIQLKPNFPQAKHSLGVSYGALGKFCLEQRQFAQARALMLQALELLAPTHPLKKIAQAELAESEQ